MIERKISLTKMAAVPSAPGHLGGGPGGVAGQTELGETDNCGSCIPPGHLGGGPVGVAGKWSVS